MPNSSQMPMSALVEAVGGTTNSSASSASGQLLMPGTILCWMIALLSCHIIGPGFNCVSSSPVQPLPMELLDSLSVHSKMSLIHSIVTHILKQVTQLVPFVLSVLTTLS